MTIDERITNIENKGKILIAEFDKEFTVLYESQEKGIAYAALPNDASGYSFPTVRYLDGSKAKFSGEAFEVELEHLRKMGEEEENRYIILCDKFKDLVGAQEIPFEKKRDWGMIGLSMLTLPLAPVSVPLGYAVLKSIENVRGSGAIGVAMIGAGLMFPLYGPIELCKPSTYFMDLQKCNISNENSGDDLALYLHGSKRKSSELELIFSNGNSGSITADDYPKKEIQASFHSPSGFQKEQAIRKYNEATSFLKMDEEKRKNFEQAVQYHAERPKRFEKFEKEMESFDHKLLLDYVGFEVNQK